MATNVLSEHGTNPRNRKNMVLLSRFLLISCWVVGLSDGCDIP